MAERPPGHEPRRPPAGAIAVLVCVTALAAVLRFAGLDWNLRHEPHHDEGAFVYNVGRMLSQGDLDHRYYEYPALFFYLLLPVLAFFDPVSPGPEAFYAARAVVAAFGVASVPLTWALGRQLVGPAGALAAAGFVAVSPVGVQTAHMVRPDVALASFVILALMAFRRARRGARDDVLSGIALAAAVAVKFTGALLVVPLIGYRLQERRSALRSLALVGLVALVSFAALTPYALVHAADFARGVMVQVTHHYRPAPGEEAPYADMALAYAAVWRKALGIPGLLLAVAGLGLAARRWRDWLPLALLPAVTVAVLGTSELRFDRHMVPSFCVMALLAGLAVDALWRRRRLAGALLAAAALVPPALASAEYVAAIRRPSTRDQVLDWIEREAVSGTRVLLYLGDLGLDPSRYEVMRVSQDAPAPRLHSEVDLVVLRDAVPVDPELVRIFEARPRDAYAGEAIAVARARSRSRLRLDLQPDWIRAGEGGERVAPLVDGDLSSYWRTRGGQRPGDWLEVEFPGPFQIERIELVLGARTRRFAGLLHVFVRAPGCTSDWNRTGFLHGRPAVDEQVAEPVSQVLLLRPQRACGIRLVQMGTRGKPWGMAELRIDGQPGS